MRTMSAVFAALLLAACGGQDVAKPTLPSTVGSEQGAPGDAIDLNAFLIGSPSGDVVWQFDGDSSAAYASGLSLTAAGLLTLPDCRWTSWPFTVSLQAFRGGVVIFGIAIVTDERVLSPATVVCVIPSNESVCRDPSVPLVVEPGVSLQFYSLERWSCSRIYQPALPDGACPLGDPAFAFCQ